MAMTTTAPAHLARRSDTVGLVRPLTIVWTPPADCPAVVQFQPTADPSLAPVRHRCAPPDYQAVWEYGGAYSPGVCISGYTVATTYGPGDMVNLIAVDPSETAAICVPRYAWCPAFVTAA
ncbi:hypothetical protein QBC34DRAFT_78451 [Podospora aff. communis PSN243]|uniref:Uncharacterized protein n=1 Tax=Podospora aff. communis PSN243 TaxID=3040156 RepID=A0AAV9GQ39_9PEZI|nr:hypothetical protein QBC34DRAFT_78451 [Podospora aff. communis PSN243]